ncbi:hypothetical protein HWV62_28019 [Athelia sp. TMB]|nr:hypothetical protein HWV62_28019 [Athelia sp. TMB]
MDQNPIMADWITSCSITTGVSRIADFDSWAKNRHLGAQVWSEGVGWLSIAYTPEDGKRSSASVAYMHPIMDGRRHNLHLMLETWVDRVVFKGERAVGVNCLSRDNTRRTIYARHEVILAAGAVDSPRLLLLSGVGPKTQLVDLGISVVRDLPGVGENLQDHPESIIMWETDELPKNTVMESDAALFIKRDKDSSDPRPDLMFHIYSVPFADNIERLGYPRPKHAICMTPNNPRPKSRGRLYLVSADPTVKPAIDFRYFTDPEDYDAKCLVDGIKVAREIAKTAPFSDWLKNETAPGPAVTSDEDLNEYARRASHTVYHPPNLDEAGTCKMGAFTDPTAVVDPLLRVRGLQGLRVVDASVFPLMVTANPMITVLMISERASDLLKADYYRNTSALAVRL